MGCSNGSAAADGWVAVEDKATGGTYYWHQSTNRLTPVGASRPLPEVVAIGGRRGWWIDRVTFYFSDKTEKSYGGIGGGPVPRIDLKSDLVPAFAHHISKVVQLEHDNYLGAGFVFTVVDDSGSFVKEIKIFGAFNAPGHPWGGRIKGKERKFEAPVGQEVIGLQFSGWKLIRLETRPYQVFHDASQPAEGQPTATKESQQKGNSGITAIGVPE